MVSNHCGVFGSFHWHSDRKLFLQKLWIPSPILSLRYTVRVWFHVLYKKKISTGTDVVIIITRAWNGISLCPSNDHKKGKRKCVWFQKLFKELIRLYYLKWNHEWIFNKRVIEFLLVECSKHLSLKIYLINFLHENCTDDGERCDSFTHMYQNPNVLERKKKFI